MEELFFKLLAIKNKFLSLYDKHEIVIYIAPSDPKMFNLFQKIIIDYPHNSISDILEQNNILRKLLLSNFPDSTELDLFITTRDNRFPLMFDSSFDQYIKKEKLNFEY